MEAEVFYSDVFLYKCQLFSRWLYNNFGWLLLRIWRDFPQTTRDPAQKTFRREHFKAALRHEWGSIRYHRLLDVFFKKKTKQCREIKRWWYILNHPQAPTRRMAEHYRARG